MSKKLYFLTSFLLLTLFASAQTIRLNGRVINSKNEALPGASVSVEGSARTIVADIEGRFSINLEAGKKYSLKVSSAGYNTKVLDDLEVKRDEENTITVVLENKTLDEVVVRTSVRRESTSALINLQKNNTSLSSGLAADFIKRTPDKNTGEILKRVSGTSIQDNRFVIVRGLGDRYNASFINGAQLPSSEPDKRAFSFDVIPSNVVDNIIINKTATPDLTGEFAGGLVQVITKDIPTKDFLTVGASLGYNTISTFKDFYSNKRSSTDWLGFQSDAKLPSIFPENRGKYNGLSNAEKVEITKGFRDDVYKQEQSNAAPIQTYNISYGTAKRYNNGGQFGTVLSVIYRKAMNLYDVQRNQFEKLQLLTGFNDKQNKYNVTGAAMANFTYVKGKHKISFKNLFNQGFENNYYQRSGVNTDRNGNISLVSSIPSQRTFYTGIFEGSHQLPWKGIKVNWNAGYGYNNKRQEDLRTVAYLQPEGSDKFFWDQDDTRRFYSYLQDHNFSGSISVTMPYKAFGETQNLKIGGSSIVRFRDFKSRIFRYIETPADADDFNNDYATLPYDQIFSRDHVNMNGFKMDEFTNNTDKYWGTSALNAGYIMSDNKLGDDWRLIVGARLEYFRQFMTTKDLSGKRSLVDTEKYSVLPSMNLTYNINNQNLVRLSASQTVSRPEFRELANFSFFDYEAYYGIVGNKDLKMTDIYNVDLRYEIYPGAGEAITLGGFFKRFVNPIELTLNNESTPARRNYSYQNAKDANTYGVELELRKNLKFLGGNSDLLSDFSLFANFTYIFSEVSFNSESAGKVTSSNRQIQGQSPYLINGGLQYSSRSTGVNATLLYNRVGNRLALVGSDALEMPHIYENARDVIDLQISKKFADNRLELKLSYGDILNQKVMFYENVDNKKTYNKSVDRVFSVFKPGSTISIGLTYDFLP